ncbi:dUTP diphosphatase [Bacillaceae bacterium IKA-2]|nr:dUTP diphosphatase [Bacillaceae bacterium IKA-2]
MADNYNLAKLFEAQKVLEERIVKEHNLQGCNLLPHKFLALQVELGELANEQRTWKYWSKDQKPRKSIPKVEWANGKPNKVIKNPLLEEYVDCLHCVLDIGLEIDANINRVFTTEVYPETVTQFNRLYREIGSLWDYGRLPRYYWIVEMFIGLGSILGFTWEQIEDAYFEKNETNHKRQEQGY